MDQQILITGATGMVGHALTRLLLEQTGHRLHLLMHRRGAGLSKADFLQQVLELKPEPEWLGRLNLLQGDSTAGRLGLAPEQYAAATQVSSIIHAAATTRFDLPLDEARRINVGGAEHILSFARDCPQLERLAFLSTAYVAGKRTGLIQEGELEHDSGFVNSYEQSKYEAEQVVAAARADLPVAVYRLSTILGDAASGRVRQFTAPHQSIYIMYLGLAAMVPGDANYVVDLMPGDYTARVLFELFTQHFKAGQTFHLTAGAPRSYTLREVIDNTYDVLAELDPAWARRRYPKPALASAEAFDLFMLSAAQANNPLMQNVVKVLGTFARQFSYPKTFSTANVLACLPGYEQNMPHVGDYYRKVIAYLMANRWRING